MISFSNDEIEAIHTVIKLGDRFGYGNLMSWLQTAWCKTLEEEYGKPLSDSQRKHWRTSGYSDELWDFIMQFKGAEGK